jgi:hypothetical protein
VATTPYGDADHTVCCWQYTEGRKSCPDVAAKGPWLSAEGLAPGDRGIEQHPGVICDESERGGQVTTGPFRRHIRCVAAFASRLPALARLVCGYFDRLLIPLVCRC